MIQKHELACLLADFHMNALADCSEFFTWDIVELKLHLCTSWKKSAISTGFLGIEGVNPIFQPHYRPRRNYWAELSQIWYGCSI